MTLRHRPSATRTRAPDVATSPALPRFLGAIVFAVALVVAACESPSPAEPLVLEGTTWRAVSIAGQEPPPGSNPTISFANGQIQGSAPCNSYSADARLEGGRLAVGQLMVSRMMCAEDRMALDGVFAEILLENDRIEVEDGQLVIAESAGQLVFVPQG